MSQHEPKVEEPKPKAPLSVHDVNPEDSLQGNSSYLLLRSIPSFYFSLNLFHWFAAIGMSEPHIVFMAASMMVFTVRQFAMMSEADVSDV